MTSLYLLDPEPGSAWEPFIGCRPVAELRAGARLIREWWEAYAATEAVAIFAAPHLSPFPEAGVPAVEPRREVAGPAIVGCSDFVPLEGPPPAVTKPTTLMHDGRAVGWLVPASATWSVEHFDAADAIELAGLPLEGAFDLVTALERLLADELDALLARTAGDPIPRATTVIGEPARVGLFGASVEPGVLIDVRAGPVVVEAGALVRSDSRLEGPLWVGPKARVFGGPIKASVIGPWCTVRGEMASTVMIGYANKAHDGFVGHTVIGRWVNLGADTVTSNLKNTYGPIALEVAGARLSTGRTFLGALIADHAKTAIGTLLSTGSVIGCGANVFGAARPPRWIPPFAWGVDGARMSREGFLRIAARVLPRRDVPVDAPMREFLGRLYDALAS